jgi:ubiquinone biosynthesis protein Coq4
MNDQSNPIDLTQFMDDDQKKIYRMFNGMLPSEAAYMRGEKRPVPTSVPHTSSKYLNSPLFRDAFTTMALRRVGDDVAVTYDIPEMSRGIVDVTDFVENAAILDAEKKRLPEFAAWLDARKPVNFDSDRLAQCAPGTLGAKVHAFISESGMEMKFVNNHAATTDMEYMIQMMGHTHDLSHLVSGFGPNMAGEHANALMALTAAYRYFSPEAAQVIHFSTSFVSTILLPRVLFNYPRGADIILEATRRGIEAGQGLKVPIFMVDYEHYLDWQLDDIAADLGFVRGPDEEWAYTEQLCAG